MPTLLQAGFHRFLQRGLPNFFQIYRPLLDFWAVIDNSTDIPKVVAFEKSGVLKIINEDTYAALSEKLELL
jgi:hypothetical protein